MNSEPGRLRALAERCEAASGPDRELDVLIACAVKYRWEGWTDGDLAVEESLAKFGEQHVFDRAKNSHASIWRLLPAYTASLDAAMTLVPEGCGLEVWACYSDELVKGGHAFKLSGAWGARIYTTRNGSFEAQAATPALALASAALAAVEP